MMDRKIRLSDLVQREEAEKIAIKNMPDKFIWELNEKTELTGIPEWIINAMIEYKDL